MMDNRGNIVIEIAIVLIIILFISGIVLNASELLTNKAITSAEKENSQAISILPIMLIWAFLER